MFRGEHEWNKDNGEGDDGNVTGGMRPLAAEEITAAFSKRDRKIFRVPNLGKIEWGEIEYLSWPHRDGRHWFVVYDLMNELHGIVMEKMDYSGTTARQCSWCATTNAGDKIRQFIVRHATHC